MTPNSRLLADSPEEDRGRLCQIRLRRRSHNLFVRLNPLTLEALVQDYYHVQQQQQQQQTQLSITSENNNDSSPAWKILPEHHIDLEKIEFLPLEIRFSATTNDEQPVAAEHVVYASFNGGLFQANHEGSPSAGTFQTFAEIPEALLPSSSNAPAPKGPDDHHHQAQPTIHWDTHHARVRILPSVTDAPHVTVVPLTTRDWKLLQAHAAWLEQGAWLQQVSIVYVGQVIPIHVGPTKKKKRTAYVLVLGDEDRDADKTDAKREKRNDLDWPDSEEDEEENDCQEAQRITRSGHGENPSTRSTSRTPRFVRLLADSEIMVVPKEEKPRKDVARQFSLCPSMQHYSLEMRRLNECLRSRGYNVPLMEDVPYGTVKLHPQTLRHLISAQLKTHHDGKIDTVVYARAKVESRTSTSQQGESSQPLLSSVFALLEASDAVGKNQVALHPLLCHTLHLSPWLRADTVSLTLLTRPDIDRQSEHLSEALRRGKAHLRMTPARLRGSRTMCLESLPQNPLAPVSIGSLFVSDINQKDSMLYQLHLESLGDSIDANDGSDKGIMLLAKDFQSLQMAGLILPSILEDTLFLHTPRKPFLVSDLLSKKTVFPSKLLDTAAPRCMNEANLMLHGPPGSGKTSSALLIAAITHLVLQRDGFRCTVAHFDCRKEKDRSKSLSDLLQSLTDLFETAMRNAPCIVILDDLDEICPKLISQSDSLQSSSQVEESSPAEMEQSRAVQNHVENLLQENSKLYSFISILLTCRTPESVSFPYPGRRKCFKLPLMQSDEKLQLLSAFLEARGSIKTEVRLDPISSFRQDMTPLEFFLGDLIPKDLEILASRVLRKANASTSDYCSDILRKEMDAYIPLSRRSAMEEPRDSFVDWTRIGGLFEAKKCLMDLVVRPMRFRRIFETSRIRLPRGILLYGPPGCGKTLLPPSLAKLVGLPLIVCRGCEILDKYIGASEAKVRELFERAAQSAPSILFIDEIDSLAPQRGSDLTGVTDRVVNQLLTFLDGVEEVASGKTVYVVASSSRPDKIDSALLRPGRFEKHILVGTPGTVKELSDLIQKVGSVYPLEPSLKQDLASGALDDQLLPLNPNLLHFSPSDIKAIFDSAQLMSVREFLAVDGKTADEKPAISKTHFWESLRSSRPALSLVERSKLQETYARFSGSTMDTPPMNGKPQRVTVR